MEKIRIRDKHPSRFCSAAYIGFKKKLLTCRQNDPVDVSPVLSKTRPKSRKQRTRKPPPPDTEEDSDFLDELQLSPPRRKKSRPLKTVVVDSSSDYDVDDAGSVVVQDDAASTTLVAEPSLEDLRNMGLVSDSSSPASPASLSTKVESSRREQATTTVVSQTSPGGIKSAPRRAFQPPRPIAAAAKQALVSSPDPRSQKSDDATQSSMASNELDAYTESLAQVKTY
jgi:hypothetical protein